MIGALFACLHARASARVTSLEMQCLGGRWEVLHGMLAFACALSMLWAMPQPAKAQATPSVSIYQEYDKLIQRRGVVASLGNDLFGDRVSLYTGALEFVQTDISLPGNNGLSVTIGRRFVPQQEMFDPVGYFADWELEIPRLHGVFSNLHLWATTGSGFTSYNRCSEFGAPPVEPAQDSGTGGSFAPDEYWHGNFLYIPGRGDEEVLIRNAALSVPNNGKSYPLTTPSGAMISCLSTLANGSGEGFEVLTPDGTLYRFDHFASRPYAQLTKPGAAPIFLRRNATSGLGSSPSPMAFGEGYLLRRREVWIMPTVITDRFGNTVTYNWSSSDAWMLNSIVASDGRTLSISYAAGTSPRRISSVSDGAHTWSYSYGTSRLTQATLPDNSKWSFELEPIRYMPEYIEGGSCGSGGASAYGARTGILTHPSGAQGSFTLFPVVMGRSYVPINCLNYRPAGDPDSTGFAQYPGETVQAALKTKKLSGPGLPALGQSWTYAYGSPNTCYQPHIFAGVSMGVECTTSSPTTRMVTVTDPEGSATRYVFGNRFRVNEGQLLQTDEGWNGSSALRTTMNTHATPEAGPYPNPIGTSVQSRSDSYLSSRYVPIRKRLTTQQGRTFTWEVASDCTGIPYCFDEYARPLKVVKTGAP